MTTFFLNEKTQTFQSPKILLLDVLRYWNKNNNKTVLESLDRLEFPLAKFLFEYLEKYINPSITQEPI